jgi:2-hydroxychromene-2-carboxylate isomerase
MKITAFVDVLSHWCLAAYPALAGLAETIAEDVTLDVHFAPIADGAPLGVPPDHEVWYYGRGALAYGRRLTSAWYEDAKTTTWHANAAVAAAVEIADVEPVQLAGAVMRAAMVDGHLFGREDEAAKFVAQLVEVPREALLRAMRGDRVLTQLHVANARLAAAGCAERPSWVLENANGDRAVLQGTWQAEALLPLVRAFVEDERAYARAGAPPF